MIRPGFRRLICWRPAFTAWPQTRQASGFRCGLISEKVQDPQTGEIVDLDEVSEVQSYLNEVEDIMWERMYAPGTNFTTALHECYLDIGSRLERRFSIAVSAMTESCCLSVARWLKP
jgi:hypothetical protein